MTKKGGVRPNWLKRFFVLSDTDLAYFMGVDAAGSAGNQLLGTIALADVEIARFSQAPGATSQEIEVCTSQRTYRFQVTDPNGPSKKVWCDSIMRNKRSGSSSSTAAPQPEPQPEL
jgi:hypothetical protein